MLQFYIYFTTTQQADWMTTRMALSWRSFLIVFSLTSCIAGCIANDTPSSTTSPPVQTFQPPPRTNYSEAVRQYLSVDAPQVALLNVKVIDGTGQPAKDNQTLLLENGYISAMGSAGSFPIPDSALILDFQSHTVIPGIVGTHNHLHMPGIHFMGFTASRLYLASGVTTIQTTGSASPAKEKSMADSIHAGLLPGPDIFHTGPYFNGSEGSSAMITPRDSSHLDEVIKHWTEQGVRWFKVYRHIKPAHLQDVIRIAHRYGAKVTGHLCSITYVEAAQMGIDAIEHGFIHSFDHAEGKETGTCSGSRDFRDTVDIDSPEVDSVQQILIELSVGLSSTPSIFEAQIPRRALADERTLQAMSPASIDNYRQRRERMASRGSTWHFKEIWLDKSMEYNLAYFRKGGLLTMGLDPGLHNLPGFGDQRNFLLMHEYGFTIEEAIQIMTSNGAQLLEQDDIGTIQVGKRADLVILQGDLETTPAAIEQVVMIFKEGYGFNPEKLLAEVKDQVGIR